MIRLCPICDCDWRELLHSLMLTYGGEQQVYVCERCAMIYSSVPVAANYEYRSIYAVAGASGSGESAVDVERLRVTAEAQSGYEHSPVLDVGCARGGLLSALRDRGFTDLHGMDPSQSCVDAACSKGFTAYRGLLSGPPKRQYSRIILSHVLEHVEDVRGALAGVKQRLAPGGTAYIEVPNAARYADYDAPFLDFNSEHINHFGADTLGRAMEENGLSVLSGGRKTISLPGRPGYPVIWIVAERGNTVSGVQRYIAKSHIQLQAINEYLEGELATDGTCIIWGANSYCDNITSLPVFKRVKVAQIVDRNPDLWNRETRGVRVSPTHEVKAVLPIVIASMLNIDSILADIEKMRLSNKVIAIRRENFVSGWQKVW